MKEKYLVATDESDGSRRAVSHAVERAKTSGAELLLVHVIDWSPYSFHTPEELSARRKRREEEISRANEAILQPLAGQTEKAGIVAETIVRHGRSAETIAEMAKEVNATQVIVGRTGEDGLKTMVFGSTASKLAQISPVPVLIVP